MSRPVLITRESPEPDRSRSYQDTAGFVWSWEPNHPEGAGWSFYKGSWSWAELVAMPTIVSDLPWRML